MTSRTIGQFYPGVRLTARATLHLAGRVAAPVIGTLAIELIMRGLKGWNVIGRR